MVLAHPARKVKCPGWKDLVAPAPLKQTVCFSLQFCVYFILKSIKNEDPIACMLVPYKTLYRFYFVSI